MNFKEYLTAMRESSPLFWEIEKSVEGAGYLLAKAHNEGDFTNVWIRWGAKRFQPEIMIEGFKTKRFGIQTTSYGLLFGDELNAYVDNLNKAKELVDWLNSLDLTQLPDIEDILKEGGRHDDKS